MAKKMISKNPLRRHFSRIPGKIGRGLRFMLCLHMSVFLFLIEEQIMQAVYCSLVTAQLKVHG